MHRLTGMAEGRAVILAGTDRDAAGEISCWLQEAGYTVVSVVERGDDAVKAATASRPGLVILDASLPGSKSPLATALEIRDRLNIPVIFTTANPNTPPGGEPYGLAQEEILVKPFGPNELATAMGVVAACHRSRCLHRTWDDAFRCATDSLPYYVMILDADRRIQFINRPGAILVGRSRATLAGKDVIGTILPPPDRGGSYLHGCFAEGKRVEFVIDCACAGRHQAPVHWTCHPAHDPGDRCAGWICFGIEEKGSLLPDLGSRDRMLRQIEANIEQLSTLNDRIRNPLQVIAAMAGFMDGDARDKVLLQVEMINETIRQLDLGALESMSIQEFLRKHHRMPMS